MSLDATNLDKPFAIGVVVDVIDWTICCVNVVEFGGTDSLPDRQLTGWNTFKELPIEPGDMVLMTHDKGAWVVIGHSRYAVFV